MENKISILHLTSEQVLANLFPILAINPSRVIQIVSNKVKHYADNLEKAIKDNLYFKQCNFRQEIIKKNMLSIDDARKLVEHQIDGELSQGMKPVVNITGGTKLMSIGAFEAAKNKNCPAIYCNTDERKIEVVYKPAEFSKMNLSENYPYKDYVAPQITLNMLISANGNNFLESNNSDLSSDFSNYSNIANEMFKLYLQNNQHGDDFRNLIRDHITNITKNHTNHKLIGIQRFNSILEKLLNVKLVIAEKNNYKLNVDYRDRQRISYLQKFFDGSWLEVYVYSLVKNNKRYKDVTLNLSSNSRLIVESAISEIDIACLDIHRMLFVLISCKVNFKNTPQLDHMLAIKEAARKLGGKYSLPILCTMSADEASRKRAEQAGIKLLIGEEIQNELSQ